MQRYLKPEDRSGLSQIDIPDGLIDNPKKDEDPVKYKRVIIKEDMEKTSPNASFSTLRSS
eukprot:scaffold119345_cov38-Attheya_sp.AAC.1